MMERPPVELARAAGHPEGSLEALELRLRRAFVARFGVELGVEVTAETMAWAWAWEHRDQLARMANPAGYLFRVGQSRSRRRLRWRRRLPIRSQDVGERPESKRSVAATEASERWQEPRQSDTG